MPPHCDSLDGPVVTAARAALGAADVELVLPYVHADGEAEVRDAFAEVMRVRALSPEASTLADRWFFETVVRVHRSGEGAPFTGLKPAGLDVGPIIPAAERSLAEGTPDVLIEALSTVLDAEVRRRHAHAMSLKAHADEGTGEARAHVEAMLGLQVWSHRLYKQMTQ